MAFDELVQTAERAARVARKMAEELREAGLVAQPQLLDHVARALESACRDALIPPDETPPSGLDALIDELEHPSSMLTGAVARRLARKHRRARSLIRRCLPALEIVGDTDLLAEANAFLEGLELARGDTDG